MAVQLNISYEQLRQLIRQLPAVERRALLLDLADETEAPLTPQDRIALLRANVLDVSFKEVPSVRREDWYGDDGR